VVIVQIIRAEHLGMCFGVRDAIALAFGRAEAAPLTILGDLVHNAGVLGALRGKEIAIAHDPAHVETHTVMVTAHGASERALASTRARGLEVVEATSRSCKWRIERSGLSSTRDITRSSSASAPTWRCEG
jgi:4-hydroxy-3-methylbut-2-en-1-yl diphosphate reductase